MRGTRVPDELQAKNAARFLPLEFIENAAAEELDFFCSEEPTGTFTNGSCHNLIYPLFGISNNIEFRYGDANYLDGESEPDNMDRPEPRVVSNMACSQPDDNPLNLKGATRLLIFLGQFLDHDFTLSLESEEEEEQLELMVPDDDDDFNQPLEFFRSTFCEIERIIDGEALEVREFLDVNTPWLDLGNVYGDSEIITERLRLFEDGLMNVSYVGGMEFPPLNPLNMSDCGDIRCEENVQLFSFHTLFLREHNRIARAYANFTNITDDEEIFQAARLRNIMQWQSIIWDFYLPYLLGRRTFHDLTGDYTGHQPGVDPTVSVLFSTAVYRYGHSGVSNALNFRDGDEDDILTIALADAFLTSSPVRSTDSRLATAIFLGQGTIVHDRLEQRAVDGIRNNLFGEGNDSPFERSDLIARNIARSRDHGLQSLNYYREIFGLRPFECPDDPQDCFVQLTGELEDSEVLFELYGDIDRCDVWVCGMAERNFADSLLGETFTVVMAEQFNRMRNGDRIWYENLLSQIPTIIEEQREGVVQLIPTRLADVVRANGIGPDGEPVVENLDLFTNAFIVEDVYIAMIGEDTFQVEWAEPEELRRTLFFDEDVEFSTWEVTVTSDSFTQRFLIPDRDELWLYLTNEDERLAEGNMIMPSTEYSVTVVAALDGAADFRIDPVVTLTTLEEGSTIGIPEETSPSSSSSSQSSNNDDGGLSTGATAGIIVGAVAGVAVIGAGVYFSSRPSYKNDDFNAAFF